jgi:transposase InsO family protein
VLDLGSRRLLGYAMSDRADTAHITAAVEMAVATRGRARMDGTIFHSDRGSTYMSERYGRACARLGLRRSASRTGCCLDNAVAESFFASLKAVLARGVDAPVVVVVVVVVDPGEDGSSGLCAAGEVPAVEFGTPRRIRTDPDWDRLRDSGR